MRNKIFLMILALSCLFLVFPSFSQVPTKKRPTKIEKSERMRVRVVPEREITWETYYGYFNGLKARVSLQPSKRQTSNKRMFSVRINFEDRRNHPSVKLEGMVGEKSWIIKVNSPNTPLMIKEIITHRQNPNIITLVSAYGQVGSFSKDRGYLYVWENVQAFEGDLPYDRRENWVDYYEGFIDGRECAFEIQKPNPNSFLVTLTFLDDNTQYGKYMKRLPISQDGMHLNYLELFSPDYLSSISFPLLKIDEKNKDLISGKAIIRNEEVGVIFKRNTKGIPIDFHLVEFPWPPAKPSSKVVFYKQQSIFRNAPTLSAVDKILIELLDDGDYERQYRSYYRIMNGFAMVTPIEKVSCQASPMNDRDERWNVPFGQETKFSFKNLLDGLSFAPPANYRMFVFLVTDQKVPEDEAPMSELDAVELYARGKTFLPDEIGKAPFGYKHYVSVWLYSFSKKKGWKDAQQIFPGNACWKTCETHLQRVGMDKLFPDY